MAIASKNVGRVVVLEPTERLDFASAPALNEAVRVVFERAGSELLLDLERVNFITSIGLSAILQSAKLAQAQGGRVVLTGLTGHVREVFDMARLESVIAIYASREEALSSFERAKPQRASGAHELETGLTLAAEVLLLALHDESGQFVDLPDHALDFALAGAVLLDLQLRRRIDTDAKLVNVVDGTPVGDPILDPALSAMARSAGRHGVEHWVLVLAHEGREIQRRVVDRLVERGILQRKASLLQWVLGGRRYPVIDDSKQREVKERVLAILQDGEVPGPHDVAIIALADACAVFDAILEMDAMLEVRQRLNEVAQLDLVAQGIIRALRDAQSSALRRGSPQGVYVS